MQTGNIVPNCWYRFTHESATAESYSIRAQWISATGKKGTPNYVAGHQDRTESGEGIWKTYNGKLLPIHNRHIEKLDWKNEESGDPQAMAAYKDAVSLVGENQQALAAAEVKKAFADMTS